MSGPTYRAQIDTINGHGTMRITLEGRYRAEKHFRKIAAELLSRQERPLQITATITEAPRHRAYRLAPAAD